MILSDGTGGVTAMTFGSSCFTVSSPDVGRPKTRVVQYRVKCGCVSESPPITQVVSEGCHYRIPKQFCLNCGQDCVVVFDSPSGDPVA